MKTEIRLTEKADKVAIVFIGKTFDIKDTLKENGFRFDRNEIDWCGLPDTTGQALWWKIINYSDMAAELEFTKELVSLNLTMIFANAEPFS